MKQKSLLIQRRTFLKTGVLIGGTLLAGAALDSYYRPRTRIIARQLMSYLQAHHLATVIGASLIADDASLQSLSLDQLIDISLKEVNLSRSNFSLFKSSSQIHHFQQQVREDFTVENIVLVNGWFLSLTEAHLCAVLHRYLNPLS